MKPEAREHLEHGLALYKAGEYAVAIDELELGRQIDPHPDFDYALGQAYRSLGDCKHAVPHYMAFLDTLPPDLEAEKVRKRCPVPAEPVTPPSEPVTLPTTPSLLQPRTVVPPRLPFVTSRVEGPVPAWYTDVPGGVVASAGFGGLVIGGTYLVLADRDIAAANRATSIAQLQQLAASAHHERMIGAGFTIAGGALAVAAATRYFLVAHRRPPDHIVSVALDRSGAFAVWTGEF